MPRFITRKGRFAIHTNYRKHGILFRQPFENNQNPVNAFLQVDYDTLEMTISIVMPEQHQSILRTLFQEIRTLIASDESFHVATDSADFVDFPLLLEAERMLAPRIKNSTGTYQEIARFALFLQRETQPPSSFVP